MSRIRPSTAPPMPVAAPAGRGRSAATARRRPPAAGSRHDDPLAINLAHLDRLSREVNIDGVPMLLVGIYAEPPDYRVIGDPDEGVACVDDVARAAQVYLRHFRQTGDRSSLRKARLSLNFLLYMQRRDGRFHNFVTDWRGTINKHGHTSFADIGWWGARAMHTLAESLAVFRAVDPRFARKLERSYRRAEAAFAKQAPPHRAADWPALAVLAMVEYLRLRPSRRTRRLLKRTANLLAAAPVRGARPAARGGEFPAARISQWRPAESTWHAWGAHTAQALAAAGHILGRKDLVRRAALDVDGVLGWQLAAGRVHEMHPLPSRSGQQAYGVSAAVQGALELARATGKRRYEQMAGLHAAWFAGQNIAGRPMYDARTGRGFDGIDVPGPAGVNRAAGAESTIEALLALLSLRRSPSAVGAARMTAREGASWSVIEAESASRRAPGARARAAGDVFAPGTDAVKSSGAGFLRLHGGEVATITATADVAGTLVFVAAHMRGKGELQMRVDGGRWTPVARARPRGQPVLRRPGSGTLPAGEHRIDLRMVGGPGSVAHVDGLLLHPPIAETTWQARDGSKLVARFDASSGAVELQPR